MKFLTICMTLALAGCSGTVPGEQKVEPFSAIASDETIRFTGTEPFWGGTVENGVATYSTPENTDGVRIEVVRFAGNNGLSFSGMLDGQSFDLAITPGECSDGMSDRSYPFVATLALGEELRQGCAWTDAQSFTGDPQP